MSETDLPALDEIFRAHYQQAVQRREAEARAAQKAEAARRAALHTVVYDALCGDLGRDVVDALQPTFSPGLHPAVASFEYAGVTWAVRPEPLIDQPTREFYAWDINIRNGPSWILSQARTDGFTDTPVRGALSNSLFYMLGLALIHQEEEALIQAAETPSALPA